MSMDKTPRLPVEGEYIRHCGRVVAIEDVTPKERTLDYIFEDTEARVEAHVNGKLLKQFATFNNHYGRDTCVRCAIEEAKKLQDVYGSGVEFVVIKVTRQTRRRPSAFEKENFYDREFRQMDALDFGCRRDLPDETEEIVWSSKRDL